MIWETKWKIKGNNPKTVMIFFIKKTINFNHQIVPNQSQGTISKISQ